MLEAALTVPVLLSQHLTLLQWRYGLFEVPPASTPRRKPQA